MLLMIISSFLLQVVHAKPVGCNSELASIPVIAPTVHDGKAVGKLVLLPQPSGEEATFPAALDGSPFGFYYAASPSTKWTINIQGGGWCYDEKDCLCRSKGSLGTSTVAAPSKNMGCSNPLRDGTVEKTCNSVDLLYLDGASFSGYRAEPWSVPGGNASEKLWFRGIKNLDATIEWLFTHGGLGDATEVLLKGESAGGLSTFLHADRVGAMLKSKAPKLKIYRAQPIVGYFQDHDNFAHSDGYSADGKTGGPNTDYWSNYNTSTGAWNEPGTGANYTFYMKYVYSMQNMTFGADGGLTKACYDKHPTEPHLCFMSPHMVDTIKTPLFMLNSKFDHWQLQNIFQSEWQNDAETNGVLQYGLDFMKALAPLTAGPNSPHGGLITSCICHGCPWPSMNWTNAASKGAVKTIAVAFADWWYGTTAGGIDSLYVDPRTPDGGGTYNGTADPTWHLCGSWPRGH